MHLQQSNIAMWGNKTQSFAHFNGNANETPLPKVSRGRHESGLRPQKRSLAALSGRCHIGCCSTPLRQQRWRVLCYCCCSATAAAQVTPITQCQRTNNCPANKLARGVRGTVVRSSVVRSCPLPFSTVPLPSIVRAYFLFSLFISAFNSISVCHCCRGCCCGRWFIDSHIVGAPAVSCTCADSQNCAF